MNSQIRIATTLAYLLDNRFNIGKMRFGLSAILDLLPGLGDTVVLLLSLYIVLLAMKVSVPKIILARMIGNIAVNYVIGLIPILGDAVYIFHKTNIINLNLLKKYAVNLS